MIYTFGKNCCKLLLTIMIKKISKYFTLSLLLLCIGCNDSSVKEVYVAPEFKQIRSKDVEAISQPIFTFHFYGIESLDNYFVVIAPIDNRFVHIYDKSTGEKISSSVTRGRANNELLYLKNYTFDKSNRELTLFDAADKSILKVVIKESGECEFGVKSEHNLHNFTYSVLNLGNDNMLLFSNTPNIDSIPRLSIISADKTIDTDNEQPIADIVKSSTVYGQARLSLPPDKSKVAIGTIYGSILETYSIKNSSIKRNKTSYFIEPLLENNTIWGMGCITSTDDYIYSVYNGSDDINGFNKIALFSWSHKPIELWEMGDCNIACLCVDNNNVYAIADLGDREYRIVAIK